jgi:hypothetical protein
MLIGCKDMGTSFGDQEMGHLEEMERMVNTF